MNRGSLHSGAVACSLLLAATVVPASRTLYVNPPGGTSARSDDATFKTLAAALASAAPGDSVLIEPGVLIEQNIRVQTPVTIAAVQPGTVVWRPVAEESDGVLMRIESAGVVVRDIRFEAMQPSGTLPAVPTAVQVAWNQRIDPANLTPITLNRLDFVMFSGDVIRIEGGDGHEVRRCRVDRFGDLTGRRDPAIARGLHVRDARVYVWETTIAGGERGIEVESTGGLTPAFAVFRDSRVESCVEGLTVQGVAAGTEVVGSQFFRNELAVRWASEAPSALGPCNVFYQDAGTILRIDSGTPPVAMGNWFLANPVQASGPGLFDTVPFVLAPGVVDATPARRLDRDADGLPDVAEALRGTDPSHPDTDRDGLPDGVEVSLGRDVLAAEPVGFFDADADLLPDDIDPNPAAQDADGEGYADWYELARGFSSTDPLSHPPLGDVFSDGVISLADAVRALQVINGSVPFGASGSNTAEMDVTGEGTVFSLNNALQILRFQAGSRRTLPARPGFN